jgi:hypothetical protein
MWIIDKPLLKTTFIKQINIRENRMSNQENKETQANIGNKTENEDRRNTHTKTLKRWTTRTHQKPGIELKNNVQVVKCKLNTLVLLEYFWLMNGKLTIEKVKSSRLS